MKHTVFIIAISAIVLGACGTDPQTEDLTLIERENQVDATDKQDPVKTNYQSVPGETPENVLTDEQLATAIADLYPLKETITEDQVLAELGNFIDISNVGEVPVIISDGGGAVDIPEETQAAYDGILDVDPTAYECQEDYFAALDSVVSVHENEMTVEQASALNLSINAASKVTELYLAEKAAQNNGGKSGANKKSWWDRWGRCAAGVVGGAGLGGLKGIGAGAVGCVIGVICGGLAGAAAAC